MVQPGSGAGFHRLLQAQFDQPGQTQTKIPQDGHLRLTIFTNLCGVDLEVDHLGARRKGVELAGDAVIEASTNSDQQIAFCDRKIRIGRAMHAKHADR